MRWLLPVFAALLASAATPAPKGGCAFFAAAYGAQVKPKILSGIPFELMSLVSHGDDLVGRKVVHVQYDLWEEVVKIQNLAGQEDKVKLDQAEAELCFLLSGRPKTLKPGRSYEHRILLNPMWKGRVERLKERLEAVGGDTRTRLLDVDWKHVAADLPKENVLVTRELKP